jgi:soluble lytic murein transglycosylase-like protein
MAGIGLLLAVLALPSVARAADPGITGETAALPPVGAPVDGSVALPQPLGAADADRYRLIFGLQDQGLWSAADRQIAKLTDNRLLGHVLAERYTSPTFRASYRQLSDWLARYAELPEAADVYPLAMKRKPKSMAAPRKPDLPAIARAGIPDNNLGGGNPDWQAGLAAYQAGDLGSAAASFAKVAQNQAESSWSQAAGAFWAARSYLKNRQPEKVSQWLRLAAQKQKTFYGQLARRLLGLDSGFNFKERTLTATQARAVMETGTGLRALALIQIGRAHLAEQEMLLLQAKGDAALEGAMITISQVAKLPSLALTLAANAGAKRTGWYDAALYPVPHWEPRGGFRVDRALVYALIRHESGFDPEARSPAGAIGLMQLMPGTAAIMGGRRPQALLDPVINVTLGQDYLARLLADASSGGDLFRLLASYNAGPGNLMQWREAQKTPDSLLFLETLPNDETRRYVQRVMASYWVYQERLGQRSTSLDAVAAGKWPAYIRQDNAASRLARNGSN